MKERLKNELVLIFSSYVEDVDVLKKIDQKIDAALSKYDVKSLCTDIVVSNSFVYQLLEMYIVSKKISGLSDKSLYLYMIVLKDFFISVNKDYKDISSIDIRLYLYKYQKQHGISNRTLDTRRTIICSFFN